MQEVGLRDLLTAMSTYLAAECAYWLVEKVRALSLLPAEWKRYVALAIAFVLADLAWLGMVGMQYVATPINARSWVEAVFAVGATAAGIGQLLHARRVLANR